MLDWAKSEKEEVIMLRLGENTKLMVWEKMKVGEELPPYWIETDEVDQGRFLVAVAEENPWYFRDSPFGGPIVHHTMLDGSPMTSMMQRWEYPFGFVHAMQETEFLNPCLLGKRVQVRGRIADKYVKRGKGYIVVEALCVDEDGVEIMRCRNHAMIDDERVREAVKSGLRHNPPPLSWRFRKKSQGGR